VLLERVFGGVGVGATGVNLIYVLKETIMGIITAITTNRNTNRSVS
jgi:hypothetical protein